MPNFDQITMLKRVLETSFIKESIYSFLPTEKPYSDLLTINNDNEFVSLSNANAFIIPILEADENTIGKIKEKLNHIFNREKFVVSFQKSEYESEFENMVYIEINDLIKHAEKNGACKRNLFSLSLKELIFKDKTYAQ
ncbi:hypothetical protein ESY86_15425 [Subsaximicrobium wynnwilliamsii]|uniref:Uncharacterized protein n=1 Tax=Subsaximicrobium wynnwilliamsii TaxID=291179 RepID=A0A5C6ZE28_9FLAO|nr:hypothetical protein [Subsaximicrobium wynnwilliamsii]TXD82220.1 hypothetical protein ESY87_15015 [Subsaximicrobium wynnwilliamsii]TXD87860.1 hypothetical protein ESY86_15425 [Subsaximicrobium wynnwilliamsii]TXE01810.1 hypothetical protein ESY88_14590 [Subsaximicrobium wynnwilliamsii]